MNAYRLALLGFGGVLLAACKDEPKVRPEGTPPPPSSSVASAVCATGGGKVTDVLSASFFSPKVDAYCIDPHGEEKTYGEKAKLGIDALCYTALDGGCEEYKRLGVTRAVGVHYVASDGPANVEVLLSKFSGDGAYAIYTQRLTGEVDPADEHSPRKIDLGGALGAMGTGKAYVQRGGYFLELTYGNDQETPEQLKKSSEIILTALAKDIASKLPPDPPVPASARALPEQDRIANGVMYFDKDMLGVTGAGTGAVGYYRSGAQRWRVVSVVRDSADPAKDFVHTLRGKPGAMPVSNIGEEGAEVVLQPSPERAKIDWVFARKGAQVFGVGDEEFADPDAGSKLGKNDKLQKLAALITK
jgi:hypothetical protein